MDFTTLRPADETTAAIGAALTRAQSAREEVSARVATAQAARDTQLLSGTAPNLAKAETALTEARRDLERMEVIVPDLQQRLASAQDAEMVSSQEAALQQREALLQAANQAGKAHNAKWIEVRELIRDAAAAALEHRRAFNQAASDYENAHAGMVAPGTPYPRPDVKLDAEAVTVREALEQLARLPG